MVNYRITYFGELLTVDALLNEVDDFLKLGIVYIIVHRCIAVSLKFVDFRRSHTEEYDIIITDSLVYLYVSSVECSESDSAVYHKFHVTRTARLCACKGYLFADICRRHESFRHGNIIIFKIDNLESALHVGIIIYKIRQGTDKTDYLLSHKVARCSFCGEDICVGYIVTIGVFFYFKVLCDNVQSVKMLTLVLVKSLDLNVEYRIGIKLDARSFFNVLGECLFIFKLYLPYFVKNFLIVCILLKLFKFICLKYKAVADKF